MAAIYDRHLGENLHAIFRNLDVEKHTPFLPNYLIFIPFSQDRAVRGPGLFIGGFPVIFWTSIVSLFEGSWAPGDEVLSSFHLYYICDVKKKNTMRFYSLICYKIVEQNCMSYCFFIQSNKAKNAGSKT